MPAAARRLLTLGGATAALVGGAATPALAHEKYFLREETAADWGFLFHPLTLTMVLAVAVVTVLWRVVAFRLGVVELKPLAFLGRLAPWIPRLLAIHLGVMLIALSVMGHFLAPSVHIDELPASTALGIVQAAIGVWLVSGFRIRPAVAALALVGPVALVAVGPVGLLEATNILGVVVFLWLVPPGRDDYGAVHVDPLVLRRALLALRVLVGVALITLALSEKLVNPDLARAFLARHEELNVLAWFGIDNVDLFIRIAGVTELLFGLLVISGAMPQVAVLVAAVPFNLTILLFGTTETIGHLPVYGVFLALLVYGSSRDYAGEVRWLPSLRRHRGDAEKAPGATVAARA